MADKPISYEKLVNADKNADTLEDFIESDENTTVISRLGRTFPSLAKAIKLMIEAGDVVPFPTTELLQAWTPDTSPRAAKALDTNKIYFWGKLTESETVDTWHDIGWSDFERSKQYTQELVEPLIPVALSPESGYVYGWTDPVTKKTPIRIRVDGRLEADNLYIPNKSITSQSLNDELTVLFPTALSPESGYVYGWVDPITKRCPVRIKTNGTFEADNFTLGYDSIGLSNLKSDVKRTSVPARKDTISVMPDPWRANKTEIGVKTQGAGYWCQFPVLKTKSIFGVNNTGTSLSIRKTVGLPILGKYYAGEYSFDNSVASTNLKGVISSSAPSTPTGTFVAGDYYQYVNGSGTESTGTYAGMNIGDLLVYNGSSWVIQKAPATFTTRNQNGYFWKVTTAGTFDGVNYAVGDLVLYVSRQTGGGGNQYERWYKLDFVKGDLAFMGQVSVLPSSPQKNGVYELASTLNYHIYDGSAWLEVRNNTVTAIAANASFYLQCIDASEYEVRRTDLSAASVGLRANCYTQQNVRRSTDEIVLLSDSMFGVSGVGQQVLNLSGRNGVVKSFGGSTSHQVMGMLEYFITQDDLYKGQTFIIWHGQNNQPSTDENAALIRECTLKMINLIGADQPRYLFLTVLGQRNLAWDSTLNRFVASQHENQKAKVSHLYALKNWYRQIMPDRYLSVYDALIAAADDTPDPTFPGLTEKQVAQTYGVVPYSYFNGAYTEVSDLTYLGTWSDAALPISTPTNGSYYLRINNGTHANIIVYRNSAWSEKTVDMTHLSGKGALALATAITLKLKENSI
ncbi:hypothetical protein [uncultured Acinetobacter sp.]|uniref:hypothetical protein n=1 Tax=uncultured Acinetobacter sp. TaxID=165433 RepID=UPI0037483C2F